MSQNRIFSAMVRNVPWTVGKKEFSAYFSQFGKILFIRLDFDKSVGAHKGFGFVHYGTKDAFNAATQNQGHFLEGNQLFVTPADKPRVN